MKKNGKGDERAFIQEKEGQEKEENRKETRTPGGGEGSTRPVATDLKGNQGALDRSGR